MRGYQWPVPAVAFTAFTDVLPRATETEIGTAPCSFGAGRTLNLTSCYSMTEILDPDLLLTERTQFPNSLHVHVLII